MTRASEFASAFCGAIVYKYLVIIIKGKDKVKRKHDREKQIMFLRMSDICLLYYDYDKYILFITY